METIIVKAYKNLLNTQRMSLQADQLLEQLGVPKDRSSSKQRVEAIQFAMEVQSRAVSEVVVGESETAKLLFEVAENTKKLA